MSREKRFFVIICNFSVSLRVFQDKYPKTNKKSIPNHNIVQGSLLGMPNYYRRKDINILKPTFFSFPLEL